MNAKLFSFLVSTLATISLLGQGAINFNNRSLLDSSGNIYHAPITFEVGGEIHGASTGWMAQLFLVGDGGALTPLLPVTDFRTGAAAGYVNPVLVSVPTHPAGTTGLNVVMAAWTGSPNFESATLRGISPPVTIGPLGGVPPTGEPPLVPPNLDGLMPVHVFPEPSTIALGFVGAAALLFVRRRRHHESS